MRAALAFVVLAAFVVATGADHAWDGNTWNCEVTAAAAEQDACAGPSDADTAEGVRHYFKLASMLF